MRRFVAASAAGVLCGMSMAGCVRTPSLDQPNSVPINQIVKRVKCELMAATAEPMAAGREFDWFKSWIAKVRLTLIVDEFAGLSPGVSLNTPLRNGYAVTAGPSSLTTAVTGSAIGAIAQSFSMGLGGAVNSRAWRVDTVDFTLSLRDVAAELAPGAGNSALARFYQDCALPEHTDLDSDLGLREWVRSALGVTRPDGEGFSYLSAAFPTPDGKHVPVSTKRPPLDLISHQVQFTLLIDVNATPTWKFVRVSANPTAPFVEAWRRNQHSVAIVLGPSVGAKGVGAASPEMLLQQQTLSQGATFNLLLQQ